MAAPLYTTASGQLFHAGQILIATVGLPARGKTHLSHALERYLLWLGVKARVFSLGDYRRKRLGKPNDLPTDYFAVGGGQPGTEKLRAQILAEFDDEVRMYFAAGNQVVIYDANNGQAKTRAALQAKFASLHVSVMFLETICDDRAIIEANIRAVKLRSPDYQGWRKDEAVKDFYRRIRMREDEYQTISDPDVSYVKIINVGQRVILNNIRGYLQSRICFFLMNVHNRDRTIYLARAGEALVEHLYKADADLSSLGWEYAEELTDCVDKLRRERERSAASSPALLAVGAGFTGLNGMPQQNGSPGKDPRATPSSARPSLPPRPGSAAGSDASSRRLEVWTSNRRRAAHTCTFLPELGDTKVVEKSQLCELNPGVVDGMSEAEIRERYPEEWERRQSEPYGARYPRAESYHDLCVRIEPVIMELERSTSDVLIVAQASVLRVLLGYLQGRPPHEIPHIDVPEGDVLEITPQAYGMQTRATHFWDPVARRRQRDQAWVREQRAASASRSRRGSARASPALLPSPSYRTGTVGGTVGGAGRAGSHSTLPSPHFGALLHPLTLTPAQRPTSSPVRPLSHAHVPGSAIPPLVLPRRDVDVFLTEEEEADLRRVKRERQRAAALDQLADELGDTALVDDTPQVTVL